MGFSQFGRSDAGFFQDFFRDYKNRMEAVAPFEAGIEAEGIDFPGRDEIRQKYQDYRQSRGSSLNQAARDLVEAYIPYRDRVARELSQRGFPDIQSGLEDFERKTGVRDYLDGRVPTYEYEQPLHELLSHQRPYELGMAPDYRNFYAGIDPEGNPVVVKSNPITPINEDLAGDLDVSRSRGLRNKDLTNQTSSITSGGFTGSLMSELNKREVLDDPSRRLLPARMELQYPTRTQATGSEVFPPTESVQADVGRALELLKDKYMRPANQRLAGLLATQFPGIGTKVSGLDDVEQFLALVEQYEGKPTDRSKYFYGTFLPGATPETVNRIAGNIRRTPSSLLPGASDLIPSAEAVRRGYQEGPQAMGEQMARDFVAGLPVAATLAPILSAKVFTPFAPGVGLGYVSTAASESLNEAVKQQTGKSLLQRAQETAGAAGGDTTVIGRPRQPIRQSPSTYVTPEITQMSPEVVRQMNAQRNAQKNENELQRRIRLAGEARQLDPYDFGVTELLFGR
jgi:hypothetical protein